ncbi:MAG: hypothetical protein ACR2K1_09385, partial [Saprospiraceae bacterium]
MTRFFSCFACLFCLSLSSTSAQMPTSFPENPTEFTAALGEFMTAGKRPDMEASYAAFKSRQKSGQISEARMQRIVRLTNILAVQRLSPFPYYLHYVDAVTSALTDPDSLLFDRWHTLAEQTLGAIERGKTKPIGQ